jgi:hypothetical protein
MSETNKGVIWAARFSPMGSSGIIPLSPLIENVIYSKTLK